jgi:salicylate hydroxylase
LHRALAGAVAASPRITATFGFRAGRLAEDSDGIRVSDDKGRSFEGQGLIGADGLWSSTRRAMESDAGSPSQARFSGYVAWRTVLAKPMDQGSDLGSVSLWLGADAHAVHYPVAAGRLFNLVVVRREPPGMEDYEQIGDRDAMLEDTARWPRPVRDLVAAAPDWRRWPLFLRDEGSAWYSGRVLLAGDAAHPLLPFLAQGAAMALEDAWAIGRALGQPDRSIEAAWRDVEQLRLPRVRRVVRASARNAQSFHLSGPLRLARDAAMRMMGGDRLLSAYDWLYGHAETEHRAPAR